MSIRHVVEFFFQVNKPPDHLMSNRKQNGAFTEKHGFVNFVLSMEIPLEIVSHFSFEIMGNFTRFS